MSSPRAGIGTDRERERGNAFPERNIFFFFEPGSEIEFQSLGLRALEIWGL